MFLFRAIRRALSAAAAAVDENLTIDSTTGALLVREAALAPATPVTGSGDHVVLLDEPGTLRSVAAQVDPGVSTGSVWLLVLDSPTLPADGVVTTSVLAALLLAHTSGTAEPASVDEVVGGVACAAGCTVVLSSTGWSAGVCTLTKISAGLATVIGRVS